MDFYYSRSINSTNHLSIKEKLAMLLKEEGFGILTEINLSETLNSKLGKQHLPHLILGACNPVYADKVVSINPHISTMLPCNFTIRQINEISTEISCINPISFMQALNVSEINEIALEVSEKLKSVLEKL